MRIALVEYGIGNVRSVENALRRIGAEATIVRDGDALRALAPDRIVMPGVGAVGEALSLLRNRGLDAALNTLVSEGDTSFLGICVGMQVMAETCEEFGPHTGLGWIPGTVRHLAPGGDQRVPHVGWNTIAVAPDRGLPAGLDGEHFYFVHSYAMDCPEEFVAARADYGSPFVAAVRRGRITGVQFHPEKSSAAGELLLAGLLKNDVSAAA